VEIYKREYKNVSLILMDLEMPKMNGIEASKLIRVFEKECDHKECPIIALTAYSGGKF